MNNQIVRHWARSGGGRCLSVSVVALVAAVALPTGGGFSLADPPATTQAAPDPVEGMDPRAAVGPYQFVGSVAGMTAWFQNPFSPDGTAVVRVDSDKSARVWDARTLKPLTGPLLHPGIRCCRIVGDGKIVFTAGKTEVRLWDVATSTLRSATRVADDRLSLADVSPDGTRFVTVGSAVARTVEVWVAGREEPALTLPHESYVLSAEFDPTGRWILTHEYGPLPSVFHVWSADTGREVCKPIPFGDESDSTEPYRARFDPAGGRVALLLPHTVAVVEVATGKMVTAERSPDKWAPRSARFSGDGRKVVVTTKTWGDTGPVRVFDAATGVLLQSLGTGISLCEVSHDGRWVLCSPTARGTTQVAELWDAAAGAKVQLFPHSEKGEGTSASMSPDGATIAVYFRSYATREHVTDIWKRK